MGAWWLLGALLVVLLGWGAWTEYDELTSPAVGKPDEVIREAIGLIRAHALRADEVDWVDAERAAVTLAGDRARRRDLDTALHQLTRRLNDGHSFYMPARVARGLSGGAPTAVSGQIAELLPPVDGVARLAVHTYASLDAAEILSAARALRAMLARALRDSPCGLLLDLTNNGGGNMYPMLSGLMPLLPQGPLLSFKDRMDAVTTLSHEGNSLRLSGNTVMEPLGGDAETVEPARRVAVLTGPSTASSGEMLVIAFKAASAVRYFGAGTAGVNSANTVLPLSNGCLLALTVSTTLDRHYQEYRASIPPDEGFNAIEGPRGAALAASRWVQQDCR